ncbi:GFA family protein [Alteraurantiacibacter aquimixticola]|uniref:GFA family protein n=1 Tax=Alteraurantiacibacter aquimixticola TaxID=2489173 RepID=A0A4V4U8R0_9SPHN|nr:GFA family protein [Alteraurantiacibacter aquimixticola]TIX51087.1 GFA family protein [Alteraurantiacibacter aquimixticola]
MLIHGQCHCGAIAYEAEVSPGTVVLCHCSDCQTFAGGPYRAMIRPEAGTLEMTGTPKHYEKTADSGRVRVQGFCGDCGSHLYAMDPDGANLALRIGAIAERHELGAPVKQVWCSSAFDWAFDLPEEGRISTQP